MEEMFKKIPQNVARALTSREKKSKIDDRYWWWMVFEKCERGLPPLKRTKLSKKAQERHDYIKKKCMNLIGGGMIGSSHYIRTSLNGLILNTPPKELNPFQFLQKIYIHKNDRASHFVGHSKSKELDIGEFYKRKQMNEEMEAEMTKMDSIQDHLVDS